MAERRTVRRPIRSRPNDKEVGPVLLEDFELDYQTVRIGGDAYTFAAGETIHTENSYKYTLDSFRDLAGRAGWRSVEAWTDAEALFSVHVLRRD